MVCSGKEGGRRRRSAIMFFGNKRLALLVIIYIGFISLGLPDNILGVAWDSMRTEFGVPVYYAGFISTLLTLCSAVSAFFSGAILRRLGTGKLLVICGFMTGCGLLGYALSPFFRVLLLFAVPLGFGQGAIDTGMNYFVARHYTSRDMNWLHCCWGIGASAGPLMITLILSAGWSWRCGYGIVSAVQLCLAGLFLMTLNLWKETGTGGDGGRAEAFEGKVRYSLRFFCCPLMMFLYCGAEYSLGLWGYLFLTQCRGYSPEAAGYAVTGYWGMLTFGRFLLGFIANRLGNTRQIRFSTLLGLAGAVLLLSDLPFLPAAALGLIGFAFATFYPAMMHAAPERFDDATAATVIGYQGGAAMLGIALLPAGFGYLASVFSFDLLPYFAGGGCALLFLIQWKVDGAGRSRA